MPARRPVPMLAPGVALQVLMLLGLVALVRVDWVALLRRRRRGALPPRAA